MSSSQELAMHENFDPLWVRDHIQKRGWQAELVPVSNVILVPTDPGAAIECSDGRGDLWLQRKLHGPRVFGQTNAVAALLTGGDYHGFVSAAAVIDTQTDYKPGTHGDDSRDASGKSLPGCAAHYLYASDQMISARHPWTMDETDLARFNASSPKELAQTLVEGVFGGKHFHLNGEHNEEAVTFNPFIDLTQKPETGKRFKMDTWFLAGLVYRRRTISLADQLNFACEVVELAKPSAKKAEILYKP